MTLFRSVELATLGVLLLSSAGCTIGEKKFACPGRPAGVHCMTTSEIYAATQDADSVAVTSEKALGDDPKAAATRRAKEDKKNQGKRNSAPADEHTNGPQGVPYPTVEKPIPVRVPGQVMRVWIAPWTDSHDRLHGGEDAFLNIASAHWALGQTSTSIEPVRFFSIQPPSVDSKGSVGKDSSAKTAAGLSERSTSNTRPKKEPSNESSQLEHSP